MNSGTMETTGPQKTDFILGAGLTSAAAVAPRRRVLIQRSPLAGSQYRAANDVWPRLAVGEALALAREPAHPHDERAVRIDWRGHKVSYLPRAENTALGQMLDRGERLRERVAHLRISAGHGNGCRWLWSLPSEEIGV